MIAFLERVIQSPQLHARWLNTLSHLENCGARLLARSENPRMVARERLRHAAEEFRHAYYFKMLAHRIYPNVSYSYETPNLLGGMPVYRFLDRLNLVVSRHLRDTLELGGEKLREVAYLAVSYAIEVRAMQIYPPYHNLLQLLPSPMTIRNVIRDEESHLTEVSQALTKMGYGEEIQASLEAIEEREFRKIIPFFSCHTLD